MKHLKHCAALLCMAAATAPALAQETVTTESKTETVEVSQDKFKVETNHFWNNWFVSVGGGGQIFFGDHDRQADFGDRIAPNLDIAVGKWFTPGIGIRFMYSGLQIKGATKLEGNSTGEDVAHGTGKPLDGVKGQMGGGYELQHSKFDMANFHADVLFNLSNLLCGYKADRFYNLSAYAGLGYARVFKSPNAKEVSANIGILNSFRLNNHFDIQLDVRGMFVNERFDGEDGIGHQNNSWGEGLLSASLGLTYRLGKTGWNRSQTIIRTDETQLKLMQAKIDELTYQNQKLKDELAKGNKEQAEKIVTKIAAANLVIFKINKTDLSNEARANLGILAELIKKDDTNTVYTITGYADKSTGTPSINEYLSKGRANAVYKCLTEEFGVNPNKLRIDYKGGVENLFYNDPRVTRAVITKSFE